MARSKPYTKKLMFADIFLTLLTSGGYLLIVLFRELWRRS